MNISNNINSAIVSGTLGFQRASDGITQNASNLARFAVQSPSPTDPQEFLSNAVRNQLDAVRQSLPQPSSGLTSDLVGLSVNSINAQASARVLDTANGTVGTLLDIFA